MRYQVIPEDFEVNEVLRQTQPGKGTHTLYRVRKVGRTTLQVQTAVAKALRCARSKVRFPALKDRLAVTWQHASLQGSGPEEIRGKGWSAKRIGRLGRHLRPTDIEGNRFTVVLRDLAMEDVPLVAARLEAIGHAGLPNYFDRQRFGSYSPGQEWIGRIILQRDAEAALRAHLSQPMTGDPKAVLAFKAQAREYWGNWDRLFQAAPRPSNFRSVLVFLRDHPEDYQHALNLVTPRILSIYLAAYQSLLWNRLVGRLLLQHLEACEDATIEIGGELLPLYRTLPEQWLQGWKELHVPLPHHRVAYNDSAQDILFKAILDEENLKQSQLKARLLRRAYIGKGNRAMLLFPNDGKVLEAGPDERFAGRERLTIQFLLPRGSYATLVMRVLGAPAGHRHKELV
jgi:tRNA pseudouridine13 synthase